MWAATPNPRASLISDRSPECEREVIPETLPEGAGNDRSQPHSHVPLEANEGHAPRNDNHNHDNDRCGDRRPPPRTSTQRGHLDRRQKPRRSPRRPARGSADGDPRHHGREHRLAEPRPRSAAERLDGQLDDHELLARLRQPAPLRRPAGRPRRPPADVPDRPRSLHRLVGRLGPGGHRRSTVRSTGRPGPRRRDALAGRSLDHHNCLPGQAAGQGARSLGCGRRRRRGDRRPRRRRPHRGRRLAPHLLRQHPGRDRARSRRPESHPA